METPAAIKPRKPDQTVCDEPTEKDKYCWGHLKQFYFAADDVGGGVPRDHVLFRCHRCGQLYGGKPIEFLH